MNKNAECHRDHDCCDGDQCESDNCHCGHEGCHCSCHFERRYQTKAEQIAALDTYLSELKLEVRAVEEKIAELHK
jgi:hypothetical protein